MERTTMPWTVKALTNHMKKNEINFDCEVQRGNVWKEDRMSELIVSILENYPIPPFYMVKEEDSDFKYSCIDGKQRSHALYAFLNGDFNLSADNPLYIKNDEDEEEEISGSSFENLPEWAKDRITGYSLSINYFEDITEDEIITMFRRLNNGKPLTAVELTRVSAKSIKAFQRIAQHPAIQSVMTEAGKRGYKHEKYAMQICAMMYMNEVSFATKEFRPWIYEIEVTEDMEQEMMDALDYMGALVKSLIEDSNDKYLKAIYKHVKSNIHFVSMAYYAGRCIKSGMDVDTFIERVCDFFTSDNGVSISRDYNSTIGGSTASANSVQKRKSVLDNLKTN